MIQHSRCVALWCNGGVPDWWSRGCWFDSLGALPGNDAGQVIHTHVPLSPSRNVTAVYGRGLAYHPFNWVAAHCRLRAPLTQTVDGRVVRCGII